MKFKELHNGIDSLYISFKGELKKKIREELEEKKSFAQSNDDLEQLMATMIIDDHFFEVKDKGKGKYSFVLVDGWYHIQISASQKNIVPTIFVQIASDLLNRYGVKKSIINLRTLVKNLLGITEKETISRVDIFVDFMTDINFEKIDHDLILSRAKNYHIFREKNIFTGLAVNYKGVISARLYNKTKEIKKSKKDYLKSIWEKNGWKKDHDVWRLEFQLRRGFLKEMSINTYSDLENTINDVWAYCTHDWFRLTEIDLTKNKSRWETDSFWKKIQDVKFGEGTYTGITRFVDKSRIPDIEASSLSFIGYLTTFAAVKGYKNVDEKMLSDYLKDLKKFLKEYTKDTHSYSDWEGYLKTKIKLKKRKFNIKSD